ncbi:hypothetical protein SEA_ODAY_70 [Gordonia phage ODay]|nr:hypothetical protein SEA_ODAY_70 [Gordonia phage ODay]
MSGEWIAKGQPVAILRGDELVRLTVITRVLKRDIVLDAAETRNRFRVADYLEDQDAVRRHTGAWSPSEYLLRADDPRVHAARERRRTSSARNNLVRAVRAWSVGGGSLDVDKVRAVRDASEALLQRLETES